MNTPTLPRWLLLFGVALMLAPLLWWGTVPTETEAQEGTNVYLPLSLMQPTYTPIPTPTRIPIPTGSINPNDTEFFSHQWPLQRMRAPDAWSISTGRDVIVAVLDTGVDYTHPDLAEKLVPSALWYDFAYGDSDPMDGYGHGTHVSGNIAAASNNGRGIAGVSWGARLMPLKVLDDSGSGRLSWTTAAIEYAVNNGARVINLSLGSEFYSSALQGAIDYALSRGVVVVAASGNCHQGGEGCSQADPVTYPAAMGGVIAVAGTTREDGHASYSNAGYYVDVSAPGGDYIGQHDLYSLVRSTVPLHRFPSGYAWAAGTSMATPHVSGLVALMLGERPSLTPADVEFIILATATDLGAPGRDDFFGHGRADARAALESVWYMNNPAPTTAQASAVQPAAPVTDCAVPHATDRLMLRRSAEGSRARQRVLDAVPTEVLYDLSAWQVLEVPTGQACQLMQALNAGGSQVAELDLLLSLPPHEMR